MNGRFAIWTDLLEKLLKMGKVFFPCGILLDLL